MRSRDKLPTPFVSLSPQELSKGFFQTGEDGYVGEYTKCTPWDELKTLTGNMVAPCCVKPN